MELVKSFMVYPVEALFTKSGIVMYTLVTLKHSRWASCNSSVYILTPKLQDTQQVGPRARGISAVHQLSTILYFSLFHFEPIPTRLHNFVAAQVNTKISTNTKSNSPFQYDIFVKVLT